MTHDEIIRMAREARGYPAAPTDGSLWLFSESHLERFAALVAAAEREACAKAVGALEPFGKELAIQKATIEDCVAAIRARGKA